MAKERRWRQTRSARSTKPAQTAHQVARLDLGPHLEPLVIAWLGPNAAVAAARILTEVFRDDAAAHGEPTR